MRYINLLLTLTLTLTMVFCSFVPEGSRYSYIVPLPKLKECYSKTLTSDDFRL